MIEELTQREIQVFNSIVESFVLKAAPVGSRYLAKKYDMHISPATVRNVMNDLEDRGLICQPHTSAGRIPTDKGYRHYVDYLMKVARLTSVQKRSIFDNIRTVSQDIEEILEDSSRVLARISNQLGVVLSPRFYQGILEKIEFVPISEKKIMLILTIKSGLVKTILMEVESTIHRERLTETASILSERLHGLSLKQVKDTLEERLRDPGRGDLGLIRMLIESSDRFFTSKVYSDFHCDGTKNIVVQPEFEDQEKMSKILDLVENKEIIIKMLNEQESFDGVSISIGEENKEELMKNCSLITTTYNVGETSGTIGVIGPTRMQYKQIVALVKFMAETLGYLLTKE